MEISHINFGRFSLSLLFRFFSRVIELINDIGVEKLGVEKQLNKLLLPAFKKLDDACGKNKGSQLSLKIADTEKLMTNATSSIIGIVNIMLKSSDKKMVEAAKKLKFSLKPYKGITKTTRKEQIADTKNLLQVLRGEDSIAVAIAVETLGLRKLVEELAQLCDEISAYENLRTAEWTDRRQNDAAEAKREIVMAYRTVCKVVEVGILTDGVENYKEFVGNLNTIISEFRERNVSRNDEENEIKK